MGLGWRGIWLKYNAEVALVACIWWACDNNTNPIHIQNTPHLLIYPHIADLRLNAIN
jgi:hypothetical protein